MVEFQDIYQQHHKLVFNLALQYVQNIEDAEEITQDVFVNIHNSLHTFKHQSSMTTWIYRIAINKSLDFIKSKRAREGLFFLNNIFGTKGAEAKMGSSNFDHPGVVLEQKEAVQRIFKAINELKAEQKTVLILSKIEGKSQKEIAEIMQLSVKAIESLLQRAKSSLAKKLNPHEG